MRTPTTTAPRTGKARRASDNGSVRAKRALTRVARAFMWLVVVVGVGTYIASVATPWWYQARGEQLLIVTSGSMEPAFAAGDAVVLRTVKDPTELRVGHVVTFWPVEGHHLVTHRVTELKMLPVLTEGPDGQMVPEHDPSSGRTLERPYIVTKGDANDAPDPNATPVTHVRGIVLHSHAGWGSALAWAQSPTGKAALLGPPLALFAIAESASLIDNLRRRRRVVRARANNPSPIDRWDIDAFAQL